MKHERICVALHGPFRVTTARGQDITPQGQMLQALLALLLTGQSGRRARAWLRAMLWSDLDHGRSSANLRQALTRIRRDLGAMTDVVLSDRATVSIDLGRIDLVASDRHDFLEGLDVRDEAFNEWLVAERMRRSLSGCTERGEDGLTPLGR